MHLSKPHILFPKIKKLYKIDYQYFKQLFFAY